MSPEPAIIVDHVSKKFRWHRDKRTSIKERLRRGKPEMLDEFWALKDVSLEVPRGTTFGLIGHNGSGKSTLLKTLAGILRPTSGAVHTTGRISALLEVGAGFHPELTGRENVYLNGAILGLSRRQIDASIDEIINFSGIGEFVDAPVKVYSSGMYVRLGFSIAVTVDPEILIVDEIVAVGDEEFQRKCFDHLHELHKRGTTIVIVSHALGIVENLCHGAAWLDHGEIQSIGEARTVVRGYLEAVNLDEAAAAGTSFDGHARVGSGEVRVVDVELLDAHGKRSPVLVTGEAATIRMHYRADERIPEAVFGLAFVHESGVTVAGPNSAATLPSMPLEPGEGHVDFNVPTLLLQPGSFDITSAIVHQGHVFDYADRAFNLRVRGAGTDEPGLVRMVGEWTAAEPAGPRKGTRRQRVQR